MLCFIPPALLISAGFLQLEGVRRAFAGMGGRSPSPSSGPKPVGGTVAGASCREPSQGPLTPQWLHQWYPRDTSIRGRWGQSHKLESIHTSNQRQPQRVDWPKTHWYHEMNKDQKSVGGLFCCFSHFVGQGIREKTKIYVRLSINCGFFNSLIV